jgi:hypothetical protein
VLCINGKFAPDVWEWTDRVPIEGEIYTVGSVIRCPHRLTGEVGSGLRLIEVETTMQNTMNARRLYWDVVRFVPIDVALTETVALNKKSVLRPRRKKACPALT